MSGLTNDFIRQRADQLELKQVDIVKELARRKGGNPENYKGIVHKWFKTDQEPGKEYLLELAEILNVSVESILRGKFVTVPDSRATAYSAALTGDKHIIDRLFGSFESTDIRVTTTDEYGKSFIDYVLEFDNYSALRTAIDAGYCVIMPFTFSDLTANDNEKTLSLLKMIIRADDVDIFSKVYSRIMPIDMSQNSLAQCAFHIPYELCDEILQSKKILHYFIDPSPLSKEENEYLNGMVYQITTSPLENIPSLTSCFNSLLNRAIELHDDEKVEMLVKTASEYINSISGLCDPFINDLVVEFDGAIKFKRTRTILAYIPLINNDTVVNDYPKTETILNFLNCFKNK